MRIISKSRLRDFWKSPGFDDSEGPLKAWYSHVGHLSISWQSWGDVKAEFGTASLVGNCVVFNIEGNKYRLVTRVLYSSQIVYVLKVMTQSEYDKGKWKESCGCFLPPPKEKKTDGKSSVNPAKKKD